MCGGVEGGCGESLADKRELPGLVTVSYHGNYLKDISVMISKISSNVVFASGSRIQSFFVASSSLAMRKEADR